MTIITWGYADPGINDTVRHSSIHQPAECDMTPSRRRHRRIAATCFLVLALSCLAAPGTARAAAKDIGMVIGLAGTAWAENGEHRRNLTLKAPLYAEEDVVTGARGKVQVLFHDDTVLAQGPDSRVTLDDFAYDPKDMGQAVMSLLLKEGTFRMLSGEVTRMNPERFTMTTPLVAMGIRGTMTGHVVEPGRETHLALDLSYGHYLEFVYTADQGLNQRIYNDLMALRVDDAGISQPFMADPETVAAIIEATSMPASRDSGGPSPEGPAPAVPGAYADQSDDDGSGDLETVIHDYLASRIPLTAGENPVIGRYTETTSHGFNTTVGYNFYGSSQLLTGPHSSTSLETDNPDAGGTFVLERAAGYYFEFTDLGGGRTALTRINRGADSWEGESDGADYLRADVDEFEYMRFGYWLENQSAYHHVPTGELFDDNIKLDRTYWLFGDTAYDTVTAGFTGHYVGQATGVFSLTEDTNQAPITAYAASGTFSCDVNLAGNSVNNMQLNMDFPDLGADSQLLLQNGSGTFDANGYLQGTFATYDLPGAAHGQTPDSTPAFQGQLYGPNGEEAGGIWTVDKSDLAGGTPLFNGTGIFYGKKQ